jgi:hypothetical protein
MYGRLYVKFGNGLLYADFLHVLILDLEDGGDIFL